MKKDDQIEQLCKLLNLTDEAISIAEGWSILPSRMKAHVQLVISDYIASEFPQLQGLYECARMQDQIRFNRLIEAAQERVRARDQGKRPPQ